MAADSRDSRYFYQRMYEGRNGPLDAWGEELAPLVISLLETVDVRGWLVLDLGTGEGKNAAALERAGARVVAIDYSYTALVGATERWGRDVMWVRGDAGRLPFAAEQGELFDLVLLQGLLDCFPNQRSAVRVLRIAQKLTRVGGWHLMANFNNRRQIGVGRAHHRARHWTPRHKKLLRLYNRVGWQIMTESIGDSDYILPHPPDFIMHTHSVTRLKAARIRLSRPLLRPEASVLRGACISACRASAPRSGPGDNCG
jgi:SAM-dependent methyltransferase